jgi:hypothetical protein
MRTATLNRSRTTTLLLHAFFGFVAAIALVASRAAADTGTAETLFIQAKDLMKQDRFSEARPILEESQRIGPASGTLLNLAQCYEKERKTASAWAALREARVIADRQQDPARVKIAEEWLKEIEPRLSYLTVNVSAEAEAIEGLEVRRDDDLLGRVTRGTAIPVDQGTHRISASAERYELFMIEVHVGSDGDRQTVEVPMLKALPPPPAPPQVTVPPRPVERVAERPPANKPTKGGVLRTTGFLAGGIGLASITVGTIFGMLAKMKNDEARKLCRASPCGDQGGVNSATKALVDANVANVTIGVGAGLFALGTILYFVSPRQPPKSEGATALGPRRPAGRHCTSLLLPRVTAFEPTASAEGVGLRLRGTF